MGKLKQQESVFAIRNACLEMPICCSHLLRYLNSLGSLSNLSILGNRKYSSVLLFMLNRSKRSTGREETRSKKNQVFA